MIGSLQQKILESIMETLPVEFSVLDENDNVLAWNKHETRIFKRPAAALGRNVANCHPPKSLGKVRQILDEMKSGKREKARFWIDLTLDPDRSPQKVLIEYHALRDVEGRYLGCLESSQNITEHQRLEGQKRLLD
jgi:PAS domain S-box-containing protein